VSGHLVLAPLEMVKRLPDPNRIAPVVLGDKSVQVFRVGAFSEGALHDVGQFCQQSDRIPSSTSRSVSCSCR
jgi:hypothetical protein